MFKVTVAGNSIVRVSLGIIESKETYELSLFSRTLSFKLGESKNNRNK
jgi:hypothetical protein